MGGKNCPVCGRTHARRTGRTAPHPEPAVPAEATEASGSSDDDGGSTGGASDTSVGSAASSAT
eukprot:1390556-Alexandrium_andersonii.AAC.1